MKKKVFVMASVHSWNDDRIFYKEVKSLNKFYDVYTSGIADFEYKEVDGIKIYGLKNDGRMSRFKSWKRLYSIAKSIKPDICHFHDPELLLIGYLIKRRLKCKVIYDVHEDYPVSIMNKQWIPSFLRKIISVTFNIMEKGISKKIDGVINVVEKINDKFPSETNRCIIKNYPTFEGNEQIIDNKLKNIHKDKLTITYVGSITEARGIKEIIKAVNQVNTNQVELMLAGSFESDILHQECLKMDKLGRLNYLGVLDHKDVPEVLEKADIGICCLHPIGQYPYSLPLKLFEYMSYGLPIICSNFEYWDSIVSNQGSIKVNPLNIDDITKAIEVLINDRYKIVEMGKYNYEYYKEHYTWSNEEKKLLNFYNTI